MKNIVKRTLVLLLCVALIIGDNATHIFAAEISGEGQEIQDASDKVNQGEDNQDEDNQDGDGQLDSTLNRGDCFEEKEDSDNDELMVYSVDLPIESSENEENEDLNEVLVTEEALLGIDVSMYNSFIYDDRWKHGIFFNNGTSKKISPHSSWGCRAYAEDFAWMFYNTSNLENCPRFYDVNEIRRGDAICTTNIGGIHWFVVLGREGNKLYTAEGNYIEKVRITDIGYVVSTKMDSLNTFSYGVHLEAAVPTYAPPSIESAQISNIDKINGKYDVTVVAKTEGGMNAIVVETWSEANGQDDLVSKSCSLTDLGGNRYKGVFTVKISDHNNERGKYTTYVNVYDKKDKHAFVNLGTTDLTPPNWNIKNINSAVTAIDLNNGTYTVTTTFNSDLDVSKVQFPTWTEKNGQDDIVSDWRNSSKCKGTVTKLSDGRYQAVHTEKLSEHNNERGAYITHIYAFDQYGREKKLSEVGQSLDNIRLTGMKVNDSLMMCLPNKTYDVGLTFSPSNASNKIVKWKTDNINVASCENGKLVTKNAGTATITGTSDDGGYVVSFVAYVAKDAVTYDSTSEYGVAYILNGGTNSSSNNSSYKKGTTCTLAAASKTGYSFLGWYDYFSDKKITSVSGRSTIVYAKWNPVNYQITYNLNGGAWTQGTIAIQNYTVESSNISLATPAKQYYSFGGWYTESTLQNRVTNINASSARNYTLYAKWNPIVHSITYYMNDTNADKAVLGKNHVTSFEEAKATTLVNPTREGFVFEGYYKKNPNSADFNAQTDRITVISKGTSSNLNIYAKWKENTYKIAYNANGGKFIGTLTPSTYRYTDNVAICSATAVMDRAGYAFKGWNTNNKGTGTHYQAGSNVSRLTKTNGTTVTLYAEWELLEYPINYYLNGGLQPVDINGVIANPSTHNVNTVITLKNPERLGYTFDGWFSTSNFSGGKVTKIPKSDQEINLYAKWTENTYKLSYNANGGKFIGTISAATYKYTDNVLLCSNGVLQNRAGYKFLGWNTKNNGTGIHYDAGEKVVGLSSKKGGSVTLYAEWELIEYPIVYYLNGGTQQTDKNGNALNPATHNITKAISLKNPLRDGYIFDGWFASADYSGGKITNIPKSDQKITLYAKWTEYSYKLSYNANGGKFIGTITPETLRYTQNVTICSQGVLLNRNGYTFTGWNTRKDGKGTHYEAGITTSGLGTKNGANVVLYAEWKLIEYPITYVLNGGSQPLDSSGKSLNPSSHTIAAAVSLKNPARTGYVFNGWYATSDFTGGKITSIPKSDQPITLYAKWTPISYKIVFNANGGKGSMTTMNSCVYDVTYSLPSNSFIAPGTGNYNFHGWNTNKNGTGTAYEDMGMIRNLASKNGATVTLYAQWTSAWVLESEVPAGAVIVDNKWEYTEKEWITSKQTSVSGYTLDSSKTETTYGNWSAWSETPITASATKDVKTENRNRNITMYRLGYVSGMDRDTGRWYYYSSEELYSVFNGAAFNTYENCYVELSADQVNSLTVVRNNGGEGPYLDCRQFNGSDYDGYSYDGRILYKKSSYTSSQNYTVYASRDIIKTYYLYKNVDKVSSTKVTANSNISNVKHYVKYR